MRVVHLGLVVDDHRFGNRLRFMVEVRDHDQQVPFIFCSRSTVAEKGLVHFGSVNGDGDMVGGVGAQTSGIFIAEFRELAECKPDALVTVGGGGFGRKEFR